MHVFIVVHIVNRRNYLLFVLPAVSYHSGEVGGLRKQRMKGVGIDFAHIAEVF